MQSSGAVLAIGRLVHLDNVLFGLTRILLQVADGGRVGWLALREGLQQVHLLVLEDGEMNVEDAVMGRRIERDLAARAVDADAAFQRLDHLVAIDGARLLHAGGPQQHALIARHREIGDRRACFSHAFAVFRGGPPPTRTVMIRSGFAVWIFEMVLPKLVASSGKNSVPRTSPPPSLTYFFT